MAIPIVPIIREEGEPIRSLDRIQILVIDNSPQVTALFKKMLETLGFSKIFEANSGFQGVHILREIKINLIITDWELKTLQSTDQTSSNVILHKDILPLSGVDFVKRLRQSPTSPNPYIPIIMFADTVEKIEIFKARDAGTNEIVLKPLSAEDLCKRIMDVIYHPRPFITSNGYKGPCRRRSKPKAPLSTERRRRNIQLIKHVSSNR